MRDYSKLRTEFNDIIDECPDITNKYKNIPGIYAICNTRTNQFYIGSSENISRRITDHKWKLKANKHYNKKLQRSYNKYGKESFIFKLLKIELFDTLLKIEQFYLDEWSPYFNISKMSSCIKIRHSEKTKQQLRERKYRNIIQYDLEGNFIKEWNSALEAGNALNILDGMINKVIRKEGLSAGGFKWGLKGEELDLRKNGYQNSRRISVEKENLFYEEYDSIIQASNATGVHVVNISSFLRGKTKINKKGYIFKYI